MQTSCDRSDEEEVIITDFYRPKVLTFLGASSLPFNTRLSIGPVFVDYVSLFSVLPLIKTLFNAYIGT